MGKKFEEIGLTQAQVFCALYNRAQPQGMGVLHYTPGDMKEDTAKEILERVRSSGGEMYVDYFLGRVMKVDLTDDDKPLYLGLYNRDNGYGAGERAISDMLEKLTRPTSSMVQN